MPGVLPVGRALNAKTAPSQLTGGVIWEAGAALEEEAVVDPRSGGRRYARARLPHHDRQGVVRAAADGCMAPCDRGRVSILRPSGGLTSKFTVSAAVGREGRRATAVTATHVRVSAALSRGRPPDHA
ncbi:hypothetical protein [Streptomyces nigrescens]|nr:hypothetical protein [Streptomyces libani]WAU02036.1 hypothetical protein STRLI_007791 [Streptomyces libani subsp. libani]